METETSPSEIEVNKTLKDALEDVILREIKEFAKDWNKTIADLIKANNREQIMSIIAGRLATSYGIGLEICYNLIKKYGERGVYEAISSLDSESLVAKAFKSSFKKYDNK